MAQARVEVNKGIVRLSSNLKGISSNRPTKIPIEREYKITLEALISTETLTTGKIRKKVIRVVEIQKAKNPSNVLFPKTLCSPNFIPMMAERGSAMAKVKMPSKANFLGKVMIHNKTAMVYGTAEDCLSCSSALKR